MVADFVEFAVALHLLQINEKKKRSRQRCNSKKKTPSKQAEIKDDESYTVSLTKTFFNLRKMDRVSFVVASILFLVFNITYWIVYMNF